MRLDAKKYLYDIQQAAARIAQFTAGKGFDDYESDAMLRVDRLVWDILETRVPLLRRETEALLGEE